MWIKRSQLHQTEQGRGYEKTHPDQMEEVVGIEGYEIFFEWRVSIKKVSADTTSDQQSAGRNRVSDHCKKHMMQQENYSEAAALTVKTLAEDKNNLEIKMTIRKPDSGNK